MKIPKIKFNMKLEKKTLISLIVAGVLLIALFILVIVLLVSKHASEKELELLSTEITNTTIDTFKPAKEIVDAGPYENKVQYGNAVISLPCELGVLLDGGSSIMNNAYTPSYLVRAGDILSVPIDLGGMTFTVTVENTSTEPQKLYQCQVIEITDTYYYYITYAGGIMPGKSTFDDVTRLWGNGVDVTSAEDELLTVMYYRDAIPAKDIYAYNAGGTELKSASQIYNVGGYVYKVEYDRSSGIVCYVSASFNYKDGIDSYHTMTYQFEGVDVIFDVLTDSYDIGDDMLYCVETIDGIDYIIAVGATDATYDESGGLLYNESLSQDSTETEKEEINSLAKEYLKYANFDFSSDYTINVDKKERKSYSGVYSSDSIYFCVSAEMQTKAACSFAFYMHPVNRSDKITKEAREFMESYVLRVRNSLVFD